MSEHKKPDAYVVVAGDGPAVVETSAPSDLFPSGPVKDVVFALEEAEDGLNWSLQFGNLKADDFKMVAAIRDTVTSALGKSPEVAALLSPGYSPEVVEAAVRAELTDTFITNGIATPGMVEPLIRRVMARLQPSTPPDTQE